MKVPYKEQKEYELVPAGNHAARLYQIIHIGTVEDQFLGKMIDKVRLTFELSNNKKVFKEGEEERPWAISQEYTFSLAEKANLRKVAEGIIGQKLLDDETKVFDLDDLRGKPCLINIVHKTSAKGNNYAVVADVTPLPAGMDINGQYNKSVSLSVDTITDEQLQALPEFLRDKMKSSEEYQGRMKADNYPKGASSEEIPF